MTGLTEREILLDDLDKVSITITPREDGVIVYLIEQDDIVIEAYLSRDELQQLTDTQAEVIVEMTEYVM